MLFGRKCVMFGTSERFAYRERCCPGLLNLRPGMSAGVGWSKVAPQRMNAFDTAFDCVSPGILRQLNSAFYVACLRNG